MFVTIITSNKLKLHINNETFIYNIQKTPFQFNDQLIVNQIFQNSIHIIFKNKLFKLNFN
jgi:hypothetical protein